jgi:hypothetical protein
MSKPIYAVTGITSQVGGAVVRTLLEAGCGVRAVVRDEAKAKSWMEKGREVAVAEMKDAAALTAAFRGIAGVRLHTTPVFGLKRLKSHHHRLHRAEAAVLMRRAQKMEDAQKPSSTILPMALPFSTRAWARLRLAALMAPRCSFSVERTCPVSTKAATLFNSFPCSPISAVL